MATFTEWVGKSERYRQIGVGVMFAVPVVMLFFAFYVFFPGGDWRFFYRAFESFFNPYSVLGYYNPPSLIVAIAPAVLLSNFNQHLSGVIVQLLSVVIAAAYMIKNGAKPVDLIFAFVSPAYLRLFASGQVDVIPLAGLMFISHPIGLLMISVKPQVLGLAGLIVLTRAKENKTTIIVAILSLILSFVIWGFWPLDLYRSSVTLPPNRVSNFQIFYLFPFGIFILWVSIKERLYWLAGLSTMFLTPYLGSNSVFPYMVVYFTHEKRMWAKIITYTTLVVIGYVSMSR